MLETIEEDVIEFLNIPIGLVKTVVYLALVLFDHMKNVCDYLGGYVQGGKIDATFEHTRWALQELACRDLAGGLQRGHGCDGLDNTCDDDKQIDECAEDIVPPDFVLKAEECTKRIFSSDYEAKSCIEGGVVAIDDCKPVVVNVEINGGANTCSPTVTATATAQGCGEREVFDVSTLEIPVKVDGTAPSVSCSVGNQNMHGKGRSDLEDANFEFSVSDNCSDSLKVKIEVLSNEVEDKNAGVMALISAGTNPTVYLRNQFCTGSGIGNCQISTPQKGSRAYVIKVSAEDDAGNVSDSVSCSTFVGGNGSMGQPLFSITSTEFNIDNPLASENIFAS